MVPWPLTWTSGRENALSIVYVRIEDGKSFVDRLFHAGFEPVDSLESVVADVVFDLVSVEHKLLLIEDVVP